MISLNHIQHQLNLCIRLIRLDPKVADEFANDKASALRSFNVLWFVFPYSMLVAYFSELNFIEARKVELPIFIALRVASYFLAIAVGLFGVYQLCRLQGLAHNFPRWLISYNWLAVLMCFLLMPITICLVFQLLPKDQMVNLSIITYCFILFVMWVHSWRMLKSDIFVAAGAAILPIMLGGMIGDFTNYRLYGVFRPFFDLPDLP